MADMRAGMMRPWYCAWNGVPCGHTSESCVALHHHEKYCHARARVSLRARLRSTDPLQVERELGDATAGRIAHARMRIPHSAHDEMRDVARVPRELAFAALVKRLASRPEGVVWWWVGGA